MAGTDAVREKGARVRCSFHLCTNECGRGSSAEFYNFPKDLQRCSSWVTKCRRPEVRQSFRRHGSRRLHFSGVVCSEHFRQGDFKNPHNKALGLNNDAIPTKLLPNGDSDSGSESEDALSTDSCGEYHLNSGNPLDDESDSLSSMDEARPASPLVCDTRGVLLVSASVGSLKKRLLDGERLNSRLRRAIDRLRRQNTIFKNKLA